MMGPQARSRQGAESAAAAARACGFLLALLACVLAACLPSTPPPLTAQEIARRSAERMSALRSLHFTIELKGAQKAIDPLGQLLLRRAEGEVQRPDRARSRIRVALSGIIVDIEAISIGDSLWLTNPLTRRWEVAPAGWSYNPAVLFDPERGLPSLLSRATELKRLADEPLDGKIHFRLSCVLAGADVAPMTAYMVTGARVAFDLWVGADDFVLRRIHLLESEQGANSADWLIVLGDFDKPVNIDPPSP